MFGTNKFLCTGINVTCNTSGKYTNIGLLNKDEFNKIGVNSYLLGTNSYWTMSEEASNVNKITATGMELVANTTSSGVRPALYLQKTLEVTGSGTPNDPYLIAAVLLAPTYSVTPSGWSTSKRYS